MTSKGSVVLLGISFVFVFAAIWQAVRLKHDLETARQEQQTFRQELDSLQQANGNAKLKLECTEKELTALRKNESELLRLRAENARLRSQAQIGATSQTNTPTLQSLTLTPIPPVQTHSLTTTMSIPAGQTAIAGGWKGVDGKRSLTLLTPTLQPQGEGARQVLVQSKIITATEEAWQQLGLQNFQSDPGQEPPSGLLNTEQAQTLLASVTNTPGAEVISSPRIQTAEGVEANLFVGSTPPPGDTNPAPGINMRLLPSFPSGQDAVELKIDLQINRKTAPEDSR